jgi:antitoxin (DNA-binding transcriptional repressor) of toxin-antitoxin stability system
VKNFKQIGLRHLRHDLTKVRKNVQRGIWYVCTNYGKVAALLVSAEAAEEFSLPKVEEVQFSQFRDSLTDILERFAAGQIDCVYLTFYRERTVAFLSPRYLSKFDLPTIAGSLYLIED